jgi:hypothetical protein
VTSYVIVYLDDVLIMVNSIDQALERLCIVLNIFTKVEFSFKYSKCPFVETSVLYLGYVMEKLVSIQVKGKPNYILYIRSALPYRSRSCNKQIKW